MGRASIQHIQSVCFSARGSGSLLASHLCSMPGAGRQHQQRAATPPPHLSGALIKRVTGCAFCVWTVKREQHNQPVSSEISVSERQIQKGSSRRHNPLGGDWQKRESGWHHLRGENGKRRMTGNGEGRGICACRRWGHPTAFHYGK